MIRIEACPNCKKGPYLEYPKGHLERWRKGEGYMDDGAICELCKGSGYVYLDTLKPYSEHDDPA